MRSNENMDEFLNKVIVSADNRRIELVLRDNRGVVGDIDVRAVRKGQKLRIGVTINHFRSGECLHEVFEISTHVISAALRANEFWKHDILRRIAERIEYDTGRFIPTNIIMFIMYYLCDEKFRSFILKARYEAPGVELLRKLREEHEKEMMNIIMEGKDEK